MSFVDVAGVQIHVQRLGEPSGRAPAVMLHGLLTGSVASWFFTSAPALARDREVVLYDLRGHGRSERPASGYSSTAHVADLHAVTQDLPPFLLVAHSYGALVAMRYALEHPNRIVGLALVEPPVAPDEQRSTFGLGTRPDRRAFDVERWLRGVGDEARGALRARRVANVRDLVDRTTILDDLRDEGALTDRELALLPGPLLTVFGRRSPYATAAERFRKLRRDAEPLVLDAGHAVHVDARRPLTDVLVRFSRICDASREPLEVAYG